jgi:hypothetical protein
MSIFVFIGPSLSVGEAKQILDAVYLPPVAMGDVLRVLSRGPKAIVIIDGAFDTVPSVWHKEILFALSKGVYVLGGSSMGALRAAELHSFGMKGIGRIFELYRDGELEADDEVAVIHGDSESGFRQISDPLVNIRETLRLAAEAGIISRTTASRLLETAQRQFYPERSWAYLLSSAHQAGIIEEDIRKLRTAYPKPVNLKGDDAILLLKFVRDNFLQTIPPHQPNFTFEPTYYWHGMTALEGVSCEGSASAWISHQTLGRHFRLNHSRRRDLFYRALFSFLLFHEAQRCGVVLPPDKNDKSAFSACMKMSPSVENIGSITARLADEFITMLQSRLDLFVAGELQRTGELHVIAGRIEAKLAALRQRGIRQPRLADTGLDLQGLSDWFEQQYGRLTTSGDAHAQKLGFSTWEDFITEVLIEYLASEDVRNKNIPVGGSDGRLEPDVTL